MKEFAYLLEPFLAQFYLLEAICGDFMTEKEKQKLFTELAKVFCLSQEPEIKQYYELSKQECFQQITDYAGYERFCRTVEFAERSGQQIQVSEADRLVLAQKREAMSIKAGLFRQDKNLTRETIATTLLHMAMQGNVDAMATLAYMEYHGLCVCKDRKNAMKRIRLCAKWNHLFGNLMGISYDTENGQNYYDTLYTIFQNASQKQIFNHVCKATDHQAGGSKQPVAKILEKAFGLNLVKRNAYDHNFAKVAFSELISAEDKEKILLHKQKDNVAVLSEIPFDAKCNRTIAFDANCLKKAPLKREGEEKKIKQNLTVATMCPGAVYTPLMLVASDDYVTDMYATLLKQGFGKTPVVELDASLLTAQDFSAGRENVFLRSLSETKSTGTVFFIKHCEALEGENLQSMVKMLDYTYRSKFKLFEPTVSLDLSKLLFVLFAGQQNAATMTFSKCCDTVWTAPVSSSEKHAVIDSVFSARSAAFGCKNMTMEEGCKAFLTAYGTRQVQQIVDGALREAIFEKETAITLSAVQMVCKEQQQVATKREFGYMGGGWNG